jgi:ATP-dependent RNA helicase RhlB
VHRIGRTARAGASGDSITFACESYAMSLPDVEKYIGNSIPVESISADLLVKIKVPPKPEFKPRGGRPGGRPGGGNRGGNRGGGGGNRRR